MSFIFKKLKCFFFQPKKKVNFSLDQKSILPSLHRADQRKPRDDSEPRCFPVFRWAVMIMGVLMLLVVILILGQLVLEFDAKYSKATLSFTPTHQFRIPQSSGQVRKT